MGSYEKLLYLRAQLATAALRTAIEDAEFGVIANIDRGLAEFADMNKEYWQDAGASGIGVKECSPFGKNEKTTSLPPVFTTSITCRKCIWVLLGPLWTCFEPHNDFSEVKNVRRGYIDVTC